MGMPTDIRAAHAPERVEFPWRGLTVSVLALAAMAAVAWEVWPRLAEMVTTGEEAGNRGQAEVSRLVLVLIFPAVTALVAVVTAGVAVIGNSIQAKLGRPIFYHTPRTQTRALNSGLTLAALFFLVAHLALLLTTAGYNVPLEQMIAIAFGVLLMGLGNLLPKLGPARTPESPQLAELALAWHRVQRPGGVAMIGLGMCTIVAALFLAPLAVIAASAFLITGIYLLMLAATLRRSMT
jgi:hypothetical protein